MALLTGPAVGGDKNMQMIVNQIIWFIGDDPRRPGLKQTPARVVRMWRQVFLGYDKSKCPRILKIKNGSDGIFYTDMILDHGYFFSHCEHHIVPFFGQYHFGYVPDKWLVGASKIARVVDYHSSRLQIAERLVHDIAQCLEDVLKPKGLILIMGARHLCKEMRGVKKEK